MVAIDGGTVGKCVYPCSLSPLCPLTVGQEGLGNPEWTELCPELLSKEQRLARPPSSHETLTPGRRRVGGLAVCLMLILEVVAKPRVRLSNSCLCDCAQGRWGRGPGQSLLCSALRSSKSWAQPSPCFSAGIPHLPTPLYLARGSQAFQVLHTLKCAELEASLASSVAPCSRTHLPH